MTIAGSILDIDVAGFFHYLFAKMRAEKCLCIQVYLLAKNHGKFLFDRKKIQARSFVILKLYQDIDVTLVGKIITQNRSKKCKSAHGVLLTEAIQV